MVADEAPPKLIRARPLPDLFVPSTAACAALKMDGMESVDGLDRLEDGRVGDK
jgi:hypothetical protein